MKLKKCCDLASLGWTLTARLRTIKATLGRRTAKRNSIHAVELLIESHQLSSFLNLGYPSEQV